MWPGPGDTPREPQWLRPVTYRAHSQKGYKSGGCGAYYSQPHRQRAAKELRLSWRRRSERAATALLPSSAAQLLPTCLLPSAPRPALTTRDHDVLWLQRRLRGVILPLQQRLPGRGQPLLLPLTGRLLLQYGLSRQCAGEAGFALPRGPGLRGRGSGSPGRRNRGGTAQEDESRSPFAGGEGGLPRPEQPYLRIPELVRSARKLVIIRTGSPFPRQAHSELPPARPP